MHLNSLTRRNLLLFTYRFDYSGKSPIEFKGRSVKKAPVLGQGGKCDALFMWWDLEMDTENKILLSCAPRWAHPTPKDMQVLLFVYVNVLKHIKQVNLLCPELWYY